MTADDQSFNSFSEFYPFYLRQHSKPLCRGFHYVGSTVAVLALIMGILSHPIWFLIAPIAGYGTAWVSHAFIEHNKPATFTYPKWSFMADYVMLWSFINGRLAQQLVSAGVNPSASESH